MQQALAFGVGGALTFYFGYESLNRETVQPGYLPVGVYQFPTGSLTNPVFNPTRGPNFSYAQDYTPAMQTAQQDLINEAQLNKTHHLLNPYMYRGDNNLGEPGNTTLPSTTAWTCSGNSTARDTSYEHQ
jgi:hypothetical protein